MAKHDSIKIIFVCHGNICRSPMAECMMADLLRKNGIDGVTVASAATSDEEIGNGIHPGAARKLRQAGVPLLPHAAHQLTPAEAAGYDLIIGMDAENLVILRHAVFPEDRGKVHLLLDFSDNPRPIADPWFTGNFDETYNDIAEGCAALLRHIMNLRKEKQQCFT